MPIKQNMGFKGEHTALTKAMPKSESLRTTVPMSIVKQFGLKEGDRLAWTLRAQDNKLMIVVEPVTDRA